MTKQKFPWWIISISVLLLIRVSNQQAPRMTTPSTSFPTTQTSRGTPGLSPEIVDLIEIPFRGKTDYFD